jgi:putative PIN family toxin of toxin-antitoxin system
MGKKVVRVFLDSNVILSGLLSEKGAPRILLDLLSLRLPFLMGSTGRYNLIEIERNLKKKMPGLFPLFKDYLLKLNLKVIPLPRPEDVRGFSGQIAEKDAPVLVSVIRSKADFLVTGDKQHFGKMKGIGKYRFQVVTPSEFIDSILPEILKGLEEKD